MGVQKIKKEGLVNQLATKDSLCE